MAKQPSTKSKKTAQTAPQSARDAAADALAFRLVVHATNPAQSRLKSAMLDKLMHPTGAAPIVIMWVHSEEDKEDGNSVIESFQLNSALDYLRNQAEIRAALEREIPAYFAQSEPDVKIPKGAGIWRKVQIYGVHFNRKSVFTRERFEAIRKLAPRFTYDEFQRTAAKQDQPETRSNFQVFVRGPWENEHEHYAQFRDGRFVEFTFQ